MYLDKFINSVTEKILNGDTELTAISKALDTIDLKQLNKYELTVIKYIIREMLMNKEELEFPKFDKRDYIWPIAIFLSIVSILMNFGSAKVWFLFFCLYFYNTNTSFIKPIREYRRRKNEENESVKKLEEYEIAIEEILVDITSKNIIDIEFEETSERTTSVTIQYINNLLDTIISKISYLPQEKMKEMNYKLSETLHEYDYPFHLEANIESLAEHLEELMSEIDSYTEDWYENKTQDYNRARIKNKN